MNSYSMSSNCIDKVILLYPFSENSKNKRKIFLSFRKKYIKSLRN